MFLRLFYRHLEDDEPLYMVVHKHWIFGLKELFFPGIAFIGTWWFLYLAPILPIAYAMLIADVAIGVWFIRNFLDYYLDGWIITDRSVIDVEWHGWFHRQSTRIDYSSIEGVSYDIQGVLGTIFRFGTVSIERIGSGKCVSLDHVKDPRDVESIILACQDECIRTKNLKDSSAVKDIIAEIVAERVHMKKQEEEDERVEV
jgi:hypothetical protein